MLPPKWWCELTIWNQANAFCNVEEEEWSSGEVTIACDEIDDEEKKPVFRRSKRGRPAKSEAGDDEVIEASKKKAKGKK